VRESPRDQASLAGKAGSRPPPRNASTNCGLADIIAASHSPLLVRLYGQVEEARRGKVWGDMKRRSSSAERRGQYQQDHRDIVAALRLRDADGATTAMRVHLARVARHLLGE
jgi:DNA-binding FadR family transcriptional regulator